MIFVTGGTGLLGSNLLFELTGSGKSVRAMYRNPSGKDKVKKLFQLRDPLTAEKRFELIQWEQGDILDVVRLEELLKDVHTIYHAAAMVSYRRRDFPKMMQVNGEGTANMVNLAIEAGVKRFVHVSSTAAVGKIRIANLQYEVRETNKWTQDKRTSGYAISKYTAEKEVWRGIEEGLNAVIINPSVMIGPGSWDDSSMTIFRTVSKGLSFYTDGGNAFVDVRDVVSAMILLAHSEIRAQRYLCTGTNSSFRDLFVRIAKAMGKTPPRFRAGALLSGIAWRLDSLIAVFTGKQTLTKESVDSALATVVYDSSKLEQELKIEFIPLDESIRFALKHRLKA